MNLGQATDINFLKPGFSPNPKGTSSSMTNSAKADLSKSGSNFQVPTLEPGVADKTPCFASSLTL
jgi:hypothetical protein